jgi:hypothetical protein
VDNKYEYMSLFKEACTKAYPKVCKLDYCDRMATSVSGCHRIAIL